MEADQKNNTTWSTELKELIERKKAERLALKKIRTLLSNEDPFPEDSHQTDLKPEEGKATVCDPPDNPD